jgi:hypothetical protein
MCPQSKRLGRSSLGECVPCMVRTMHIASLVRCVPDRCVLILNSIKVLVLAQHRVRVPHVPGSIGQGHLVQGTRRPRDTSSKGNIVQGAVVQGTHRPRDTPSKGHVVQGTPRPGDTSSKGRNIRDFSFADTPVGTTEHCTERGDGVVGGGGRGGKGNFRPSFDCFLLGSSWGAHRLGIRPVYPYFQ